MTFFCLFLFLVQAAKAAAATAKFVMTSRIADMTEEEKKNLVSSAHQQAAVRAEHQVMEERSMLLLVWLLRLLSVCKDLVKRSLERRQEAISLKNLNIMIILRILA